MTHVCLMLLVFAVRVAGWVPRETSSISSRPGSPTAGSVRVCKLLTRPVLVPGRYRLFGLRD